MALIEALLEELPVRADLGQSCLATKIRASGPSLLGGSSTAPPLRILGAAALSPSVSPSLSLSLSL